MPVSEINKTFDLIIFRFTLSHLTAPKKALEEAGKVLNPGGYLYLEEISDSGSFFSHPPNAGYDTWAKAAKIQMVLQDSDLYLGQKLPYYLSEMGFAIDSAYMHQPILLTAEQKNSYV
ncbi:MAG: hypothetical protein Tsb0021_16580 [Chlamydiales bacterium]